MSGLCSNKGRNQQAHFDKIQIKEVTSHFRNGWIFFVVYPKSINSTNSNVLLSGKDSVINSQKIRPFILEKVIVKAKKAKELAQDIEEPESDTAIFQEDSQSPTKNETPMEE